MAAAARVESKPKVARVSVGEQLDQLRAKSARGNSCEKWRFSEDRILIEDPQLTTVLEAALDEFTIAGLSYEVYREALSILRHSGRYSHHVEQGVGTAYDDLKDNLSGAISRLINAQELLGGACERVEVYLKQRSGLAALDTLRARPFTNALTAAIEGYWGFFMEEHPMPADERREWIANVSVALSVLRTIETAEREEKPAACQV